MAMRRRKYQDGGDVLEDTPVGSRSSDPTTPFWRQLARSKRAAAGQPVYPLRVMEAMGTVPRPPPVPGSPQARAPTPSYKKGGPVGGLSRPAKGGRTGT
jgi:hypothetical protein